MSGMEGVLTNQADFRPTVDGQLATKALVRTWSRHKLPPLPSLERQALLDAITAWLHGTPWLLSDTADTTLLWEYGERHGLGGLLGTLALADVAISKRLPAEVTDRYWSTVLRGEQARRVCAILQQAGKAANIPIFFVKGPVLMEDVYSDDGMREFEDLDVFVPSANDARRLAVTLGMSVEEDSERGGAVQEVRDPGRMTGHLEGWEIEIRYPIKGMGSSVSDMFTESVFQRLLFTSGGLAMPTREWHLLFLVQHMATNHFFSRLVWFLDVAKLVQLHGAAMDWAWVERESRRLHLTNCLTAVGDFCRQHLHVTFPDIWLCPHAWNAAFIRRLCEPAVVVAGPLNWQGEDGLHRRWCEMFGLVGPFLLADPPQQGPGWLGQGGRWITDRLRAARNHHGFWMEGCIWVAMNVAPVPLYLLARLLAQPVFLRANKA